MISLKEKATSAFIWDFSGRIITHGTMFIVLIFLTRLLEPYQFGLIAMIMVVIGIAQIFTDIGLGAALIQRRHLLLVHYSSVFYFNIIVGVFLSIGVYLLAPLIASFYNNEKLIPIVQAISLMFVINAFSSVQNTKLRKELQFLSLMKANFLAALLSGIIAIILALYEYGVWSLVVQVLSRGIFYNILLWYFSEWKPDFIFSLKALKQLWSFGFRMFLAGIIDTIYTRLDYIVIGKIFNPSILGFYERAKSLDQMVVVYSAGSLMSILFPLLSKLQNDLTRFQQVAMKALDFISFVVFMIIGILYLVSSELILTLYGDRWQSTIEFFKILIISGFAYPISALLVNILSSMGNSKQFLRLEIYKKIILLVNMIVGLSLGIEEYLYGLIIASILIVYINIIFASKEIKIPIHNFVKPIFAQAIIGTISTLIVLTSFQHLELNIFMSFVLKTTLFLFIYIIINSLFTTDGYIVFKTYSKQYIANIKHKKRKK